jgi:hypothetical protein
MGRSSVKAEEGVIQSGRQMFVLALEIDSRPAFERCCGSQSRAPATGSKSRPVSNAVRFRAAVLVLV